MVDLIISAIPAFVLLLVVELLSLRNTRAMTGWSPRRKRWWHAGVKEARPG